MRITMHENNILNVIAKCHPTKSSLAKITKATGMARNDVGEVVGGLKKLGYLNLTEKGEVYLIEDGRKYLGIDPVTPVRPLDSDDKKKPLAVDPILLANINDAEEHDQVKEITKTDDEDYVDQYDMKALVEEEQPWSVFNSINALEEALNKPVVVIDNLTVKIEALERLGIVLSDDIEELLLLIRDDLVNAAA